MSEDETIPLTELNDPVVACAFDAIVDAAQQRGFEPPDEPAFNTFAAEIATAVVEKLELYGWL
jgi:hypothetical protein